MTIKVLNLIIGIMCLIFIGLIIGGYLGEMNLFNIMLIIIDLIAGVANISIGVSE